MSSDRGELSSGISLPQWMKSKISDQQRYNLDDSTFSPPSHDDSFFYMKFPRTVTSQTTEGYQNINDILRPGQQSSEKKTTSVDFTKHTKPCQEYIPGAKDMPPQKSVEGPMKSNGTDDGFKGKGAACGSSILKVAQSIIGSQVHTPKEPLVRGNSSPKFEEGDIETAALSYDSKRRGSQSLPASPLGSPKGQRRAAPNPYFTGQFVLDKTTPDGKGRGWLLSVLSSHRSTQYDSQIAIDEADEALDSLDLNNAARNKNTTFTQSAENLNAPLEETGTYKTYKAKPSELREMNFWCPTSM